MFTVMRKIGLLGIALLGLASACTRSTPLHACVPGVQVACACLGGTSGIQVCAGDGSRYDTCICERAKADSTAQASNPSQLACPTNEALSHKLGAIWKIPPKDVHVEKCAPGAFPAPGWVVVAWLERGGGVALRHAVLEQSSGALISSLDGNDTGVAQMDYNQFKSLRAVDLDKDGKAEILQEWEHSKGGRASQLLTVYRLDGKRLQELLTKTVAYDNTGEYGEDEKDRILTCEGNVTLTDDSALVINVKLKRGHSPSTEYDCSPGRHVFKMENGKLVESAYTRQ